MQEVTMEGPTEPPMEGPARRRVHPGLAVACAGLAFLMTVAYVQQAHRTGSIEKRRKELASLVVDRQRRAAGLEKQLADLRARVRALGGSGKSAALEQEIERLAQFAGETTVAGPGLTITLADSPLAAGEGSPDFLIQDVDVQLIVNELWLDGAEGVAINGQRIVSTSAIRSAGRAILVNYKVLTSPYRIDAIGAEKTMRKRLEESAIASRFHTWSQVYRLSIKVQSRSRVVLPAFGGSGHLSHAHVIPSPSPSPSPQPRASASPTRK